MRDHAGIQPRGEELNIALSVRDYRGFDAKQGWRHGVAHGADLLLQLSRNRHAVDAGAHAAGRQRGPKTLD